MVNVTEAPAHGQTGYTGKRKCRCDICRAANSDRARRGKSVRLARVAAGDADVPHGRGGYTNWGCRCDVCTKANTDACCTYRRARIAKRKDTVT